MSIYIYENQEKGKDASEIIKNDNARGSHGAICLDAVATFLSHAHCIASCSVS